MLLANLGSCADFAGGTGPLLRLIVHRLSVRDWRGLVAWMVAVASHRQRGNAALYRRWLATRSPRTGPQGPALAVISAIAAEADHLASYLHLAIAEPAAEADLLVVADSCAVAAAGSLLASRADIDIAAVEEPTLDAVLVAVRGFLAREASSRYRFVLLYAPGCVPGEMPFPASQEAVLYYGDEDWVNARGDRERPFFKPGFSPDLLLHQDYLSSCLAMTSALAERLPSRHVPDWHSLALMLVEAADRVEYVDAFVVHRYFDPPLAESKQESCATGEPQRIPAYLPCYLRRRYGDRATVEKRGQGWRCRFAAPDRFVSVIVPTRDRADLLRSCVRGLYKTNDADRFEVIVVDNGSVEEATKDWLRNAVRHYPRLQVVSAPGEFNWSRLNNLGMARAGGDVFVFLNNDIDPMSRHWLDRLADVASRPDVGAAGALLLYPTGAIQHAGVVLGFGGCADHIYRGIKPTENGHLFVPPTVPRNVAAVTGACMAVSRDTVVAIGPFDENYRVAGGDVEICIRALGAGLMNVYLPDVQLVHLESQTRPRKDPAGDVCRLKALIAAQHPADPFYNPNLSMASLYPSYPI